MYWQLSHLIREHMLGTESEECCQFISSKRSSGKQQTGKNEVHSCCWSKKEGIACFYIFSQDNWNSPTQLQFVQERVLSPMLISSNIGDTTQHSQLITVNEYRRDQRERKKVWVGLGYKPQRLYLRGDAVPYDPSNTAYIFYPTRLEILICIATLHTLPWSTLRKLQILLTTARIKMSQWNLSSITN